MVRRLKAAAIHLLISVVVFTVIVSALVYFCYPWPYYKINGLWQGLRITASVDLILGPLLTLVVFSKTKSMRELRMDVGVIAAVQIGALIYGVITLYTQRPYATIFVDRGFETVRVADLPKDRKTWGALEKQRDAATQRPALMAVRPAQNTQESVAMFVAEMTNQAFPAELMTRLEPVNQHWPQIVQAALALPAKLPEGQQKKLDDFLQAHQTTQQKLAFFPLHGSFDACMIALQRDNGDFVGYLDITPTTYSPAVSKKHG
ncbi:hypothetical protein [Silvimonas sp.]|uniref:hypothetical protein n=1 Tax=Silvimonas sp. TaxID=2650811 RepID=UPI00283D87D6|nr:hypothetical protein [Silvimonas sp.]MDR3430157.1 hypothetical protein [Silvimonas sp.]